MKTGLSHKNKFTRKVAKNVHLVHFFIGAFICPGQLIYFFSIDTLGAYQILVLTSLQLTIFLRVTYMHSAHYDQTAVMSACPSQVDTMCIPIHNLSFYWDT